jgi:plastocyanin
MKRLPLLISTAVFFLFHDLPLRAQGRIEGTVKLPARTAEAVAAKRYQVKNPAAVGAPEPPVAAVYLEGAPIAATSANSTKVTEMGQKHFQFAPGLLIVQKGTRVEFPNFDDEYHNVFSYSKSKRFDLGRYRKDEKPAAQVFDQPGVIRLRCEIHEHMRGMILVVDTPFFTKTDTNGVYQLENAPAGNFVLKAWVDEKTIYERPVEVKSGETLKVDFPVK